MKDLTMKFRIDESERRSLEVMAYTEGRNLSRMLRELIREGAQRRGLSVVGLVQLNGESQINQQPSA